MDLNLSKSKDIFNEHCLFCDPPKFHQGEQILLQSDNFYLFAGVGPIVEGYIIIAPHRCDDPRLPLRCLADFPPELLDELVFLRGLISEFYRENYPYKHGGMHFEHGRTGVCLQERLHFMHCYHAHLCCYPVSIPLWQDMRRFVVKKISGLYELNRLTEGAPYLLFERCKVNVTKKKDAVEREVWEAHIAIIEGEDAIPPQFFRKLLAARLQKPDIWNWEKYPELPSIYNLIQKFRQWLPKKNKYALTIKNDGIPYLNFMKSVVQANKVGNDYVAQSFYETWAGREQYRAIGKFLANLPFYSVTPVESQPLRPRILDAGCGPGNYVKAFDDLGLETVGIDISTEMLAIASQVTSRSSALPGASPLGSPPLIMEMDALSPEFPDNFFDGIWYSAIFVHIPKIQAPRTLAKLHSILKDEGVLYLSTQTGEGSVVRWEGRMFFYYTEDELKKLFWDAGFQAVEEWGDITIGGTQSDTKKKLWRHYLLKKRPFQTEPVLANLGERELLNEIRKRFPTVEKDPLILGVGDDCAALSLKPGEIMVVTTDPCPTPVINLLENRQDYWHEGWFSMIINLSDLASMGATPLGFLMAVEAEEGMPLKKLERFFTGVRQAADTFQCPVIGGNVKDGPRFHCVGTALGAVQAERILRRDAAESGELMVVLGDMGHFWAGVIHYLENIPLRSIEREFLMGNLKRPLPRVKEGMALVQNGLSRCAMDSSDGLVACFYEIARTSQGVDVHLDFSQVQPHPLVLRVAGKAKIDVRKLMLAWGDWQLVCTVRKEKLSILKKIMKGLECPVSVVGHLEPGTGQVWYHDGKGTGRLSFVASERFTPHSYFSHGLASYLKIMRQTPLYTPK